MRVYKLTHSGMAGCVYCTDLDVITGELDTADIGDKIGIEIAEMSQDEFDKLPEFEGVEEIKRHYPAIKREPINDDDKVYPCVECGTLRSKREGGTIFTLCDKCWGKHFKQVSPVDFPGRECPKTDALQDTPTQRSANLPGPASS